MRKGILLVLAASMLFISGGSELGSCEESQRYVNFPFSALRVRAKIARENKLSLIVQASGTICKTPKIECPLPHPAPIGTPCWCQSAYGPVEGRVR